MAPTYRPLERGHIVTDTFGWQAWRGGTHWGTDYGRDGGSGGLPVFAVRGGTVVQAGPASGFGQWVLLDHPTDDGGGTTVYGHVIPEVRAGDRVEAGQRIARINPVNGPGNGNVPPHLHLEWYQYVWVPVRGDGTRPGCLDPEKMFAETGAVFPGEAALPASPAPAVPAPSGASLSYGIDVSNHQKEFDFARAAGEGYVFATHKVTEGASYVDPYWARAKAEMQKHFPGRWGGYVFCRTNTNPDAEAEYWLKHAGPGVWCQIDYEDTTNGGSIGDLIARVKAYQQRGVPLLPIYIPRWFWRDRMGSPDLSGLPVPVWNSHYVSGSGYGSVLYERHPDLASAWSDMGGKPVAILQFSEAASIAGQSIDANAVRGDLAAVEALFGADSEDILAGITRDELKALIFECLETYVGPIGNDVKDVRQQLTGARNDHEGYPGFPQGGKRTLYDLTAAVAVHVGVSDTRDQIATRAV